MNIALIAHDEKKELMVQFCIAYCGVLSRNNLCATGTTGKMVSEATGLTIQKFLAGSQGCLLYTSPSPRDLSTSRMPSSA